MMEYIIEFFKILGYIAAFVLGLVVLLVMPFILPGWWGLGWLLTELLIVIVLLSIANVNSRNGGV